MTRILFVDDRPEEIIQQWRLSDCEKNHQLLPLDVFESIKKTLNLVAECKPDIIVIGYGLGKPEVTGKEVIQTLRERGYKGYIIGNSGGGADVFSKCGVEVNGNANRKPYELKKIVDNLL